MDFKRKRHSSRTPEGYRLATADEVRKNFEKLKSRKILNRSERVRVLDGCITVNNFVITSDSDECFPKDMLIVRQSTRANVSRSSGPLRKDLYSGICLQDSKKPTALNYACWAADIEAIYWLVNDTSQIERFRKQFKDKEKSGGYIPEIVNIMKMLLDENPDARDAQRSVEIALDYALDFEGNAGPAMEVDHAIAIAELVLDKCSNQRRVNIVRSQIDRLVTKARSFEPDNKAKGKHIAILAKLLSESGLIPLTDRDHGDILAVHFGELLKEAVRRGYISLVKELLNNKAKFVEEVKNDWETLLKFAADWEKSDDSDALSLSIFEAVGKEFVKKIGTNLVHLASLRGRANFCKKLVNEYKLEVEAVDCSGQNLLHYAAKGEHGHCIVDFLNDSFADQLAVLINGMNKNGETPLHVAAMYDNIKMVTALLASRKADLKITDYARRTPLHLAAQGGHVKIVQELLSAKLDPLERDIGGKTALHYAVTNINGKETAKDLVQELLNHSKWKCKQAFLLWISAAGIGTADEIEGLDPDLEMFLKQKKNELADVDVLKEAAMEGNHRLTWELLNRGGDIAELRKMPQLRWVTKQIERFSEQATDRPTIVDTLGRDVLAQCIAAHFLNPYIKSPITVSISGGSGMGKTSLMNRIEADLLITAATLAFPYLWQYEDFRGAKKISLSTKGERMCHQIEKGVANLLAKANDKEYEEIIRSFRRQDRRKVSLVYFLEKYLPEYEAVYKYLACMDFNQLLKTNEEDSVHESSGQALGAVPRVLTISFNAGNYRGRHEAWAGLALEITKEIEASMTRAQWLSTCWRNAWRRHSQDFYLKFLLPALLLTFMAGWMAWAAWMLLDRFKLTELKNLKYGSIPATIIAIVWSVFGAVISVFKPVSTQMSGYFNFPDYAEKLGYQQKVISDITFLKEEIGKKPYHIFSFIAGEMCKNWLGLWEDNIGDTNVPKYGSAPESKLRIIAFVDDLDNCEDAVILQVLWAINLVFRVCEINVILAMDKNTIQTAFKNSSQNPDTDFVDKFISKIIQLPVCLPDPGDDEWTQFLKAELGREPNLSISEAGDEDREPDHNVKNKKVSRENVLPKEDKGETIEESVSACESQDVEMCLTKRPQGKSKQETEECEGCIPFSYTVFKQRRQGLSSWLHTILSWLCRSLYILYFVGCSISYQAHSQQPEYEIYSQRLVKRVRQIREMLMMSYTDEEVETFDRLKSYATGIPKFPREWKCYLNYHKFARNVVSIKEKRRGISYPIGWEVQFVVWTFVCSQWKHEMNVLIQEWYKYVKALTGKDGKAQIKQELSLKKFVSHHIEQRWAGQSRGEQDSGEAAEQKEWVRLKEALDTIQEISRTGVCGFEEFNFQWRKKHHPSPETEEKERERWARLLDALHTVQDVTMEAMQCFQQFRFHCDARNLIPSYLTNDTKILSSR